MTAKRAPRLGVALLQWLGNNEPLVGDLVEDCPQRSTAWFWRQVAFAVLAGAMTGAAAVLREPQRLGGALAAVAMFLILSFQIVVSGSLLDKVIRRIDQAGVTRINHPEWMTFVVLLSLLVAWVIGWATRRLHRRSRLATVVVCGASAAIAVETALAVLSSEATGFFPAAPHQTAAAMAFAVGLLAGGYKHSGEQAVRRTVSK